MDLNYQRMIIGYHGCDAEAVVRVLAGNISLDVSENQYDWLGKGIYFWEQGPQRAYEWAREEAKRAPRKIQTPAILGAYINLGQCFDLLDTANTRLLGQMYPEFRRFAVASGKPMPKNQPAPGGSKRDQVLRYLDCAVINWSLDQMIAIGKNFQTVRGIFVEGKAAFPGAKIMAKSHIQIAVRDPRCIIGFFRPNADAFIAG